MNKAHRIIVIIAISTENEDRIRRSSIHQLSAFSLLETKTCLNELETELNELLYNMHASKQE